MDKAVVEHLNPTEELKALRDELCSQGLSCPQERQDYIQRRIGLIFGHMQRYAFALKHVANNSNVLDAACGEGYGTSSLGMKAFVCGMDKDAKLIAHAGQTYGANSRLCFKQVDLEHDDIGGPYDVIVSLETLEHLSNPGFFLRRLKARTAKLIVSVPTYPTKHANPFHLHDFTSDEFKALVEEDGWNIIDELNQQNVVRTVVAVPLSVQS
jgi:hypothetical protein